MVTVVATITSLMTTVIESSNNNSDAVTSSVETIEISFKRGYIRSPFSVVCPGEFLQFWSSLFRLIDDDFLEMRGVLLLVQQFSWSFRNQVPNCFAVFPLNVAWKDRWIMYKFWIKLLGEKEYIYKSRKKGCVCDIFVEITKI